jgi:hypothetical protein
LCLAALSAVAFVVGMHGSGQATLLSGARAAGTEDLVLNAEMVAGEEGWALTSQDLSWTSDGGRTWTPVGPPKVAVGDIESVYFANSLEGTVLATGAPSGVNELPILAYRTVDGGRSWTSAALPEARLADVGSVKASFADAEHGFVAIEEGALASGNAQVSGFFATVDGGQSWTRLPAPPVAGYMSFSSQKDGWLVGGSTIYRTIDAGNSWIPVQVPAPANVGPKESFGLPRISSSGSGLLPVTYNDEEGHTTVGVFETTDDGASWSLLSLVPLKGIVGPGINPPDTGFIDSQSLVVLDPGSTELTLVSSAPKRLQAAGASPQQDLEASGVRPGLTPFEAPANSEDAFGVVHRESCEEKAECTLITELLVTHDSAESWMAVTPP